MISTAPGDTSPKPVTIPTRLKVKTPCTMVKIPKWKQKNSPSSTAPVSRGIADIGCSSPSDPIQKVGSLPADVSA